MAKRLCEVLLHRNPWKYMLSNAQLLVLIEREVDLAYSQYQMWLDNGEIAEDDSFGFVMLDPTRAPWQAPIEGRILFQARFGPEAVVYIPNGVGKAVECERMGMPNDVLLQKAPACLRKGSFAWGGGVCYEVHELLRTGEVVMRRVAFAGGSGLTSDQDVLLGQMMLDGVMESVSGSYVLWIAERRRTEYEFWGWLSTEDLPPNEYAAVASLPSII